MNSKALLLAIGLALLTSAAASAGPIPVTPSPVPSVGESLMVSLVVGKASTINVDWMVIPTGAPYAPSFPGGLYAYLYQIENTSATHIDAFSITLPPGAAGTIVAEGVLPGDNLDVLSGFHPDHTVGSFPILATELDPFPLSPLPVPVTFLNVPGSTITWTFNSAGGLPSGAQSDTMYFLSTVPPVYGNATAQDSIPPSPWATSTPFIPGSGAQPVPVPVPEPSALALAALGMIGAVIVRRRRVV